MSELHEREVEVAAGVGDDGQVRKVHATLLSDAPIGESSQRTVDDPDLGTPEDAIEPPLPLGQLRQLTGTSGVRRSSIDAIARNTVGLGYNVELVKTIKAPEGSNADEDREQLQARLEACARRDRRLHGPTLTDLLYAVKWDEEEVGQGFMEVSRDRRTDEPDGFFHVQASRMRRKVNRDGWVLLPPDGDPRRGVEFCDYGTPAGRRRGRNEVIVFQLYTSESRDYGLPRDSSLQLEYLADSAAAAMNASFFDASGVPPTVLFVAGEENKQGQSINVRVPSGTAARIADTLKAGGNRASRVAVIPVPPGVKPEKVELGRVSDRDMGFVDFRHDMRRRILGAFRLSPIFVADLEDAGRYTAEVERAVTLEQVFDPEQSRYEARLHGTVVSDLGYPHLTVDFKRLAVEGDSVKRESVVSMSEAGTVTRREYRAAHGYAPIPEAETDDPVEAAKEGKVPKGWNDAIVEIGQPRGAENRTLDSEDQRGQRPGIGGRQARSRDKAAQPVERAVQELTTRTSGAAGASTRRAVERARRLVGD